MNSALQRARATLAAIGGAPEPRALDADDRELLARYVDAFERYDIDAIVAAAARGRDPAHAAVRDVAARAADIGTWMLGPGLGCRGSRVMATEANGSPAVAQWRPTAGGGFEPWALHVLEVDGGRVAHISSFLNLDPGLFQRLGLPVDADRED